MIGETAIIQAPNYPADKADALSVIHGLIADWAFEEYGDLDSEELQASSFDAGSGFRGLPFVLESHACYVMKLPADTPFSILYNEEDLRVCFSKTVAADLQNRSALDLAQLAADLRLLFAKCGAMQ